MKPHLLKFNDNINLLTTSTEHGKLEDNQYYVLMVTDIHRRGHDKRVFFDKSRGWLGLERTGNIIYISKDRNKRTSYHRGTTMIAEIKDPNKCCILGGK